MVTKGHFLRKVVLGEDTQLAELLLALRLIFHWPGPESAGRKCRMPEPQDSTSHDIGAGYLSVPRSHTFAFCRAIALRANKSN
jgi:hypothetical protein